jgi:4-alpha-glucanotransferase
MGQAHVVSDESLSAVLKAIGLDTETANHIDESMQLVTAESSNFAPKMLTGTLGHLIDAGGLRGNYLIRYESGGQRHGVIADDGVLPAIAELGYHRLEIGGAEIMLAVAPPRAYTLADAGAGRKLWGLAVQLYALRRDGDGGIGDFAALADFARLAAARGADAVAISPVHAQFSNDVTRFGPYAPSNRAALNVMHIAEPSEFNGPIDLVKWPEAAAAKMAALRAAFARFQNHESLVSYRTESGIGTERHAIFEALQSVFNQQGGISQDWRHWPASFRDPDSSAVKALAARHSDEVTFHAYLQYRAERDLAAAQVAARQGGMKIGLIADLAVGTDPAGSHSWSRQDEVLRGVEIGAPPDSINREGQSWGITAFSPRGLRNTGFAAFIEMLRHALRHAGGVRIDHIMGLARLWVIPQGFKSSQGAYLRMPARDLLRLVALESQRHQAVILGEDLGTLPDGFQELLSNAGISGLRVLWFEKDGQRFKPPSTWSTGAVAMTSTHDLSTVAGWWRGKDIEWRQKLGMAGDDSQTRDAERHALWRAFQEADVTGAEMPSPEESAAAADAACVFLGKSASALALLPVEDALAAVEQPNLPGTIDEHPNWRRRLPATSESLFDRPDVAARLSAINKARKN